MQQKQKQKMQQQKEQKEIAERIKSHVENFVVSVILMKYIVLLYKNDVISDFAKKSYLNNLSNLLDEQTKPGDIDTTNPLASIHLSDNLIKFISKNLNTHDFIENLKFACTAGHNIHVMKLDNIMNSVKPLKPYVNSVLKTVKLPDKEIIDNIYEEKVSKDDDLNKFLQEIVSFADDIAKEIVSPNKTSPQMAQPKHQTHHKYHILFDEILNTFRKLLESLKNKKKNHGKSPTTVPISQTTQRTVPIPPTKSEKALKLLGIPAKTDGKTGTTTYKR